MVFTIPYSHSCTQSMLHKYLCKYMYWVFNHKNLLLFKQFFYSYILFYRAKSITIILRNRVLKKLQKKKSCFYFTNFLYSIFSCLFTLQLSCIILLYVWRQNNKNNNNDNMMNIIVPEAAPQHVNCTALSSQSLKISWLEPPLQFHGGIIQGYKILYRPIVNQSEFYFMILFFSIFFAYLCCLLLYF